MQRSELRYPVLDRVIDSSRFCGSELASEKNYVWETGRLWWKRLEKILNKPGTSSAEFHFDSVYSRMLNWLVYDFKLLTISYNKCWDLKMKKCVQNLHVTSSMKRKNANVKPSVSHANKISLCKSIVDQHVVHNDFTTRMHSTKCSFRAWKMRKGRRQDGPC